MSEKSSIEWTESTWNPTTGCTKISPGCLNCYIERTPPFSMAGRKFVNGTIPLLLHEDRLDVPLRWKKPRMIFVNSLSDLFHDDVPDEFIAKVIGVMAYCRQHTFQILTKRAERLAEVMNRLTLEDCLNQFGLAPDFIPRWPLDNCWWGVSVENRRHGLPRIPHLLRTPAAVRFLSVEPLLEDLGAIDTYLGRLPEDEDGAPYPGKIDWVIVGGESGPGARPCNVRWLGSIVAQCKDSGVPVFVKQLGSNPYDSEPGGDEAATASGIKLRDKKGGDMAEFPRGLRVREMPERNRVQP